MLPLTLNEKISIKGKLAHYFVEGALVDLDRKQSVWAWGFCRPGSVAYWWKPVPRPAYSRSAFRVIKRKTRKNLS